LNAQLNSFLHLQTPALNSLKTTVHFSKQNVESFIALSGKITLVLTVISALKHVHRKILSFKL